MAMTLADAEARIRKLEQRSTAWSTVGITITWMMLFYWFGLFRLDSSGMCLRSRQTDNWRCVAFTERPK